MNFYGVEDGTYNVFFGTLKTESSGFTLGVGISVGITVGYSHNAQSPHDLAGTYKEIGVSGGPYGATGGYSYAYSEKGISIHLVTVGLGVGTPEFHWVGGKPDVLWSDSWGD
jgi:hypothetical protein